jgi:hypothetical protein
MLPGELWLNRDVSLSASFCGLRIQWGREPASGLNAKRNRATQRRLTLICWTARIRDVRLGLSEGATIYIRW